MSLPLPDLDYRSTVTRCYTAEQMQAYGQARANAALEEVAKYAENFLKYGGGIAEEIRGFKS